MEELITALQEALKLMSSYANLLNVDDHGNRVIFDSIEKWFDQLQKSGVLPSPEPLNQLSEIFKNLMSSDKNISLAEMESALKIINVTTLIEYTNAKDDNIKKILKDIFNTSALGLGRDSEEFWL